MFHRVLRTTFYLNDQQVGVDSASYDGYACFYAVSVDWGVCFRLESLW